MTRTNKIPNSVFKIWKQRQTRGDIAAIVTEYGISKPTVVKALTYGKGSDDTILKISRYFANKKDIEQQALEIMTSGNKIT